MFKQEPSLNVVSISSIQNIAQPMMTSDIQSMPVTLYDKSVNPIHVVNIGIPTEGFYAILFNDKLYTLRNSIYIETIVLQSF